MAARAIWKGVIKVGTNEVPVKLYSGVTDKPVRFRLPLQQSCHGGGAAGFGEVSVLRWEGLQSGEDHGLPVAAVTRSAHLGVRQPADHAHPPPPAGEQVLRGLAGATGVVDVYVPRRFGSGPSSRPPCCTGLRRCATWGARTRPCPCSMN